MTDRWDLTANDSCSALDQYIMIRSTLTPLISVAPPEEHLELQPILSDELSQIGGFDLIWGSRLNVISDDLHQALLEESLEEYRGIWNRLSQR